MKLIIIFLFTLSFNLGQAYSVEQPDEVSAEDMQKAEDYVHQGKLADYKKGACKGKKETEACNGRANIKIGGIDETMIKMASKMYSMFAMMGLMGDLGDSADDAGKKDGADDGCSKGSSKYCDIIPMATEMMSMSTQQGEQANIEVEGENAIDKQRESYLQIKRSHLSRAKVAETQFMGWGSAAACYTITAAMSAASKADKFNEGEKDGGCGKDGRGFGGGKTVAKIAGATFLAYFYRLKADKHKKMAKVMQGIADGMPSMGDCNPYTQLQCYCTEATTKADARCFPKAYAKRDGTTAVSCVTYNGKVDEACGCAKTNTCIDVKMYELAGGMDFGRNRMANVLKPVKRMYKGSIKGSNIKAVERRLGAAKKFLKKHSNKALPVKRRLSAAEKAQVRAMRDMGIPAQIGAHLASQKGDPAMGAKLAGGLSGGSAGSKGRGRLAYNSGGGKVLSFSGGGGSRRRRGRSGSRGRVSGKPKGGRMLSFPKGYGKGASIHNRPETSIFKILSNRYSRLRGRLEE